MRSDEEPLEVIEVLKTLSAYTETRHPAQVRERAMLDELTEIALAEQRGLQEGLQDALDKMIASGITELQARTILGLKK